MPPTITAPQVAQIEILVDGAPISKDVMNNLFEVEVEASLYLPSMFIMRFYDKKIELIDAATLKEGKPIEIKFKTDDYVTVIKGEITALEPDFNPEAGALLTVRGYDRSHRLHRGVKAKVYINVKDTDIVSQLASSVGLSANSDATSEVYKHVFQYGVSDWAFIHERARRNGYEVLVDDTTLYFRKASTTTATVTLAWGETLVRFQPRFSLAKQVDKVTVKGWDPKEKQAIVGVASTSSSSPSVGLASWGGGLAQSAFKAAEVLEVRHPVATQGEATKMAQAILDEINAGFLQADGVCYGNPTIKPGVKVTIQKVGTKFSGNYIVSTARHIYSPQEGYQTHFTVQGARAQTLADMIDQSMVEQRATQFWGGIVTALVTNNNDAEGKMGRVKLKFPWLDDQLESNWARVSSIGAGSSRGMMWLPEVNDEVLVAFEHGDFDYPYVVGTLWNGKDAPPETAAAAVKNGKVEIRTITTRLGHKIKMTDGDSDKLIEIIGSAGDTIKFDETSKKITVESKGDIDITATGNLTLKGVNVKVEASGNLEAKATGTGKLESSGPLTVKGAVVNIN